jgi:hypothetical protein
VAKMANNSLKSIGGGSGTGATPETDPFTLTPAQILAKQVTLSGTPILESLQVNVDGAPHQSRGIAWDYIAPNIITWSGYSLESSLLAGNLLEASYLEA